MVRTDPAHDACDRQQYREEASDPFESPRSAQFFGAVADRVIADFHPRHVLDAGCGQGFLMEAFFDRDIVVLGRDRSSSALSQVRRDIRDFAKLGSPADPIGQSYDLIACVDVLDHLSEQDTVRAINNICSATDLVLFSTSPDRSDGPIQVAVRPTLWWLRCFADQGFAPVEDHSASYLAWHACVLRREAAPIGEDRLSFFAHELEKRAALLAKDNVASLHRELLRFETPSPAGSGLDASAKSRSVTTADPDRLSEGLVARLQEQLDAALDRETRAAAAEATSREEMRRLHKQLHAIEGSLLWKSTAPLRAMSERLPRPVRQLGRLGLRCVYWLMTPRLTGHRLRYLYEQYSTGGAGAVISLLDRSSAARAGNDYGEWVKLYDTLSDADRSAIRAHIDELGFKPLISIVVPAFESRPEHLRDMIKSVQAQLYTNWELCIADDASSSTQVVEVVREFADADSRIKWVRRDTNGNVSAASNSALDLATGPFVALVDHDDLLPEHALYEVAVVLDAHPDAELIYSDEDKIDEDGRRYEPYFKTDYSYDLLLGQNYVSHLGVYRRSTLVAMKGFSIGMEGSQDYDLVLRLVHSDVCPAERIHHIPVVLYHWRQERAGGSFSQTQLARCVDAGRRSITDRLAGSRSGPADVLPNPRIPYWNRIKWPLPANAPLVSIIIPTRDRADLVGQCVQGLLHRTAYQAFEIIIVDNGSVEQKTHDLFASLQKDRRLRVIRVEGEFNYSALNNHAAREAKGDILLLLNNDIEVMESHWLDELVALALRPDVGVVGAKLLYADGTIQHAGVRLGGGYYDRDTGIAAHFGQFVGRYENGYLGQLVLTRDVSAVTGACLAIRREVYLAVGGLDEVNLKVAFNDVDLCLRVREAGYKILWTPFAELYHLESASRGADLSPEKAQRLSLECQYMIRTWKQALMNDGYYNLNLNNELDEYHLSFPPRRSKTWRSAKSNLNAAT